MDELEYDVTAAGQSFVLVEPAPGLRRKRGSRFYASLS